jgi:hypothetical protein
VEQAQEFVSGEVIQNASNQQSYSEVRFSRDENEKIILKKLRAMKPHDKMIFEKKEEKNPTEFRIELQSSEYLKHKPEV